MYWLARVLDGDLEAFATVYEPKPKPKDHSFAAEQSKVMDESVRPGEETSLDERDLRRAAP